MKKCGLICVIVLLWIQAVLPAQAAAKPKVLLLYSAETEEQLSQVRILDSLVGHFTDDITLMQEEKFQGKGSYTHVFYAGLQPKKLSRGIPSYLGSFSGPVFIMGYNSEQLPKRYGFVRVGEDINAKGVSDPSAGLRADIVDEDGTKSSYALFETELAKSASVILHGIGLQDGKNKPLLVRQGNSYYFASDQLDDPYGQLLGEALFSLFDKEPMKGHPAYLRLEDIKPGADPQQLRQIASYLKKEGIPYIMCVIPVNMDTGQHLSDVPELVKVLRYMQDNGGSVILHGYTHQYHPEEKTGEGFEFWDVKHDAPIFQPAASNERLKTRTAFADEQAYRAYIKEGQEFEEQYIRKRILQGMEELTTHDLYPVAFEAPHYTMSQRGYKIVSEYFSTYLGQVQISDQTWMEMYAPSYETTPAFFHGMRLLPETIGFYDMEMVKQGKDPIAAMVEKAKKQIRFSDGYIAGFYHPSLGLAHLRVLIQELKRLPDLEWVDLQKQDNWVHMPDLEIRTDAKGIHVKDDLPLSKYKLQVALQQVQQSSLYVILVIAGMAVLLFGLSIGYLFWRRGSMHG